MSAWRDSILAQLQSGLSKIQLVADPDRLLVEQTLHEQIQAAGFELLPFEDAVSFRYAYESQYRMAWDRGERSDQRLIVWLPEDDLDRLPYDLDQVGDSHSFSLSELFACLSYTVVASLDLADLDHLYAKQAALGHRHLGERESKQFVLEAVFRFEPDEIETPAQLLRVLLALHFRGDQLPDSLKKYVLERLRRRGSFRDWPLSDILSDREAFFAFLQARWPRFLQRHLDLSADQIKELSLGYEIEGSGPTDLPFEDIDVRVYIDDLFTEGWLQPLALEAGAPIPAGWIRAGIVSSTADLRQQRLARLFDSVSESIPNQEARYAAWLNFAARWAQLKQLAYAFDATGSKGYLERMHALIPDLDDRFSDWLNTHYSGLIHLPPTTPVMLHHIPRFLARQLEADPSVKIALVVLDGLAYDQWIALREVIVDQDQALLFHEQGVFAWAPTLTSVSRQALFAGRPPFYFPDSINRTNKEPNLWTKFWEDQGLQKSRIAYEKGLGSDDLEAIAGRVANPRIQIFGLVVNTVDDIMHGMQLGEAGMHNQVRQWVQQGYLHRLLGLLLDAKFQVWITSDHGNIEAMGCGNPAEGMTADMRGQRVRVYSDRVLLQQVQAEYPQALAWPAVGLPHDFLPLLAPGRKAFVRQGERTVAHGGVTIDELIVPFVRVEKDGHG